jgi:hypothetical protein
VLLRFGVANFQSIRDYQEISFVASPLRDDGPALLPCAAIDSDVVPAAILYGANASGKTTMIAALGRLCNFVENSHVRGGPNTKIGHNPFALDPAFLDKPTRLDCDFVLDDVRYHYGFEIDGHTVTAEWLHVFNGNFKSVWFDRSGNKDNIQFGRTLKGKNRSIQNLTRENSLFLSAAAQNSHDQLTPIFTYLTTSLRFRMERREDAFGFRLASKGKIDPRALAFLKYADTGIVAVKFEEVSYTDKSRKLSEGLAKLLKESIDDDTFSFEFDDSPKALKLGHATKFGDPVFLDLIQESRGTAKLLDLLIDVYDAIDAGGIIVLDEIDSSLHTLLAKELIELFGSPASNPNGSQLIATTHDTNLMQSNLFRRDQIWLCEKDGSGASCVYPLTDISVRKGDNFEKGYLQGRFGAIPMFGIDRELLIGHTQSAS